MTKVKLPDFLTLEQIRQAVKHKTAKEICRHVIEPNIVEINRKIGQENDPLYLAYVCEYIISKAKEAP